MKKNQLLSIMFLFAMITMQGQTDLTTLGTGVGTKGDQSVYIGNLVGAHVGIPILFPQDSVENIQNTFMGFGAAHYFHTGTENTFVGRSAGAGVSTSISNTGSQNSFFGSTTGKNNTTGGFNSFYGRASGHLNTTGSSNAFFGAHSGYANTTGLRNTYVGAFAGNNATTGNDNVFIGYYAGNNETGNHKLHINNSATGDSLISGDFFTNQVGINTNYIPSAYTLAVDGSIIVEEVFVQISTSWPDYVFAKDYKLPKLTDVEKHIKEKGHLPNIPSAAEVKKEGGISLGEMNKKLLEKVEELTLYLIEQNKNIKKQEKRIKALEAKLAQKKG